MYVSIDKDNLVVRHVHSRHEVVQDLVFIELAHVRALICPADGAPEMLNLTDLELMKLYENIVGVKHIRTGRKQLQQAILDAIKRLPESQVAPWEVKLQAAALSQDDQGHYRYAPGSTKAMQVDELFALPLLTVGNAQTVVAEAVKRPVSVDQPAAVQSNLSWLKGWQKP